MHSTRKDVAGLVWNLSAYTDLIKTARESSNHTTAYTFAGSYRKCRKNIHCRWPSWQAWTKPVGKLCDIGSYPLSIRERVIPHKSWIFIFKRFLWLLCTIFMQGYGDMYSNVPNLNEVILLSRMQNLNYANERKIWIYQRKSGAPSRYVNFPWK